MSNEYIGQLPGTWTGTSGGNTFTVTLDNDNQDLRVLLKSVEGRYESYKTFVEHIATGSILLGGPGIQKSALSASDSVGTPVDSLLNIQDPTQNYAPSPGDSSMRDVLEKLANAGFTDDQIIGMRQATMESMSKDGFEFPEKIWHKAAEDYLNYKHLYTDYNDYLDSLHTKEDK